MGVLWIGTWAGLASLPPTRSAIRWCCGGGEAGNPTVSSVVALETDGRGRIWAGTFGSGLFAIDTLRGSVERVAWAPIGSASMGHDNVFDLAWDASGHLWVATLGGGVTRVDPTTAAARTWAVSEVGNALSVEFDRSGVLWVGTQYEGLHTFDPGRDDFVAVGTIEPSLDLGASYVWAIEEGPEGDLWIGTFGAGVRRIGPDRRWVSSYTVASHGLGGDRVLAVHADPSGAVWIGTQGGGLSRLIPETGEVDVFTTADGLPHDHVVGLVTDESGFLWITTNGGLARFDPDSERFRVFTTAAGLQGDRFFANAAHRAASGELLFGGPGGINVIDPEGSEWSEAPPATVLTRFLVNNEDRRLPSPEAGVQLDWDENFFAFEYAALDFTDPGLNRYRYMLRGVDRDWIDAGEVRSANYTAIPPGRYTFELSASNAPGVWSESVVRLPVRILPPFWGTVWFRGAIAALVFATISGIYALRVDQRRRLHALRQRIAGELHDDIGANLSTIALKAEVLRERAHLDEDARKRLSDVVRLSRNTVDALREMIWVVNTDSDTVGSLISRLEATAQTLVEGAMHLRFRSPPRVQDFQIDMQLRQDVYLLFKEAVHNAVKHSGGDIVDIEIALQKRLLSIVVEDDGIGFDPEDPVAGNGLPLMERRAKAHNGRFEVGRSAGGGTRVAASFTVS